MSRRLVFAAVLCSRHDCVYLSTLKVTTPPQKCEQLYSVEETMRLYENSSTCLLCEGKHAFPHQLIQCSNDDRRAIYPRLHGARHKRIECGVRPSQKYTTRVMDLWQKSPGSRTVPFDLFSLSGLLLDFVGYIDDLQGRWFEAGVSKGWGIPLWSRMWLPQFKAAVLLIQHQFSSAISPRSTAACDSRQPWLHTSQKLALPLFDTAAYRTEKAWCPWCV